MGYKNPLIELPEFQAVLKLPIEQRRVLASLLRAIRSRANAEAEQAWKRRKGPIAFYNRVVSTYARHIAHALTVDDRRPPRR